MPTRITGREKQILQLICDGLTNKEIACRLDRSIFTVQNHLQKVYFKLEVNDRFEAIEKARKKGFLV
ncbi:MAG: LuxR C-terminal-related transcriptional regulator [Candidatus Aquicultor sp.]|nr:LuxR C-terminal-related transcriptional regulator [Candidatus Aquicultor sp.]